jgi:hypothetical protein
VCETGINRTRDFPWGPNPKARNRWKTGLAGAGGAEPDHFCHVLHPLFVAVVCISREAGSWKWGAFSMVFNTLLAFSLAVIIFQTGSALGV